MNTLKQLSHEEAAQTARTTLDFYDRSAEAFWRGTRDHDVSQNRAALLDHLHGLAPYHILDFGCGPGRDLKVFRELGHIAIGLDGAERFVSMAKQYTGCEVWQQDFLQLDLPLHVHSPFASCRIAALFHIPSQELPRVLTQLGETLKPDGVLFSSNPRGNDHEGWQDGRYASFYTFETWQRLLIDAGFQEVTHYYRPPGRPRHQQPWLATVWWKASE